MAKRKSKAPKQAEVLPPEVQTVQMPDGTPLGLGILGSMRFDAIRRVLHHYELAIEAAVAVRDAEAAHDAALVRRAAAHEQLLDLDSIRAQERLKILTATEELEREREAAKLRKEVEMLGLKVQLALKARELKEIESGKGGEPKPEPEEDDEISEIIKAMRRMPAMAEALVATKAEIIQKFGGEDKLGEEGQRLIEILNALILATMQKQANGGRR